MISSESSIFHKTQVNQLRKYILFLKLHHNNMITNALT